MSAPAAANAPPARTRTNLYGVAGDSQSWGVNQDSPLVTALPFIGWQASGAGARRIAHRLAVVGALLPAARKPTADELRRMRARMLLSVELERSVLETLAFKLDEVGAWNASYATPG